MRLLVLCVLVVGPFFLTAGAALGEIEVIDFAELPAGTIVDEVYGTLGTGPVMIFGLNPRMGESVNAAVIFDSAHPTGEDPDLGSPNESFEIDGLPGPGRGAAGVKDTEFQNSVALGKLLIIAEDLVDADNDGLVDDPDDMGHRADKFTIDFTKVGPVTVHRMTLIDVELGEGRPVAKLLDAGGREIRGVNLPVTGDNGMTYVDFGPTPGVFVMTVDLGGSGAISSFRFEREVPVLVELPQTASRLPLMFLTAVLLICLGGTLRLARR